MILAPIVQSTVNVAAGAASATFGTLVGTNLYMFVSTVACWIAVGAAPTAVPNAAGSLYVPANTPIVLQGPGQGTGGIGNQPNQTVAVIEASGAGEASLARLWTSS